MDIVLVKYFSKAMVEAMKLSMYLANKYLLTAFTMTGTGPSAGLTSILSEA